MFEVKLKTYYKDDREVETVASAEHFVAFEEHFDQPVLEALKVGKLTHLYYLAWLCSSSGVEFKEWIATVRDVDPARADDVPPFGPTTSDATSPS
jgi:hypothetical protein